VRAPGNRTAHKRPIKMTRHPEPPRVAPNKSQKPQKEKDEELRKRNPINPETFGKVKAR
jgi:hypothetical protein